MCTTYVRSPPAEGRCHGADDSIGQSEGGKVFHYMTGQQNLQFHCTGLKKVPRKVLRVRLCNHNQRKLFTEQAFGAAKVGAGWESKPGLLRFVSVADVERIEFVWLQSHVLDPLRGSIQELRFDFRLFNGFEVLPGLSIPVQRHVPDQFRWEYVGGVSFLFHYPEFCRRTRHVGNGQLEVRFQIVGWRTAVGHVVGFSNPECRHVLEQMVAHPTSPFVDSYVLDRWMVFPRAVCFFPRPARDGGDETAGDEDDDP
mmetsp:Transcript_1887/g.11371  ORF Transcript_1887/g.11371 Transcript_1887/m.11371 type:complete len:255 (-) Transcript_1887:3155-3919(-)